MKTAHLLMGYSGTGLELVLLIVLIWRRVHWRFPFFFFCRAFTLLLEGALALVVHKQALYFYIYWIGEALYVVLSFMAIREGFNAVFSKLYSSVWVRSLFPFTAAVLLLAAAVRAASHTGSQMGRLPEAIVSVEVGVRFLQVGIFGLFLLLTRVFRSFWDRYAFGILLGFGISGAGTLSVLLLRSEFGTRFDSVVGITPPIAYLIAETVWLITFVTHSAGRATSGNLLLADPDQVLADVKRNTDSVKEILKR
jgi:hypothetical protein